MNSLTPEIKNKYILGYILELPPNQHSQYSPISLLEPPEFEINVNGTPSLNEILIK